MDTVALLRRRRGVHAAAAALRIAARPLGLLGRSRGAARSRLALVIALAALASSLAGCGGGHGSAGGSQPPSAGDGTPTEVATAGGSGASGSASAGTATAPPEQASASGSPAPRCRASALAVWLGLGQGEAAAGSTYYPLEFTNVSRNRCRLTGFPGVSARAARQLGSAAGRNRSRRVQPVTLAPGTTAHAVLQITNVFNFPAGQCRPATARTLRVYPPGAVAFADIPFGFAACSRRGPIFLSVEPVQAGVGVPGYPNA